MRLRATPPWPHSETAPERRLIVAVLHCALLDLAAADRKPLERESAVRWITSPQRDLFSFEWCCQALGFRAEPLRRQVLDRRVTARQLPTIRSLLGWNRRGG